MSLHDEIMYHTQKGVGMKKYKLKSKEGTITSDELRKRNQKALEHGSSRNFDRTINVVNKVSSKAMSDFTPVPILIRPDTRGLIPSSGTTTVSFKVIGPKANRKKGARKEGTVFDSHILQSCMDFRRKHLDHGEIELVREWRSFSE
jgi:hypothetical protein